MTHSSTKIPDHIPYNAFVLPKHHTLIQLHPTVICCKSVTYTIVLSKHHTCASIHYAPQLAAELVPKAPISNHFPIFLRSRSPVRSRRNITTCAQSTPPNMLQEDDLDNCPAETSHQCVNLFMHYGPKPIWWPWRSFPLTFVFSRSRSAVYSCRNITPCAKPLTADLLQEKDLLKLSCRNITSTHQYQYGLENQAERVAKVTISNHFRIFRTSIFVVHSCRNITPCAKPLTVDLLQEKDLHELSCRNITP